MPTYLKYGEKVKGDVKGDHPGWIELTSVQFGTGRGITSPTGRAGPRDQPRTTEIVVTKESDSASQHLFREALSGEAVTAFLDFLANDGHVYLRVEMKGTLISSFNVSGSGARPMESLTLNFTEIKFESNPSMPPP